jgi:hypothetical protein
MALVHERTISKERLVKICVLGNSTTSAMFVMSGFRGGVNEIFVILGCYTSFDW